MEEVAKVAKGGPKGRQYNKTPFPLPTPPTPGRNSAHFEAGIKANGLREPIVTAVIDGETMLVDGRISEAGAG